MPGDCNRPIAPAGSPIMPPMLRLTGFAAPPVANFAALLRGNPFVIVFSSAIAMASSGFGFRPNGLPPFATFEGWPACMSRLCRSIIFLSWALSSMAPPLANFMLPSRGWRMAPPVAKRPTLTESFSIVVAPFFRPESEELPVLAKKSLP